MANPGCGQGDEPAATKKILTNKNPTIMTITFDTETVLRDIAELYAKGKMTTDEYLDTMEAVCRQHCQPANL